MGNYELPQSLSLRLVSLINDRWQVATVNSSSRLLPKAFLPRTQLCHLTQMISDTFSKLN